MKRIGFALVGVSLFGTLTSHALEINNSTSLDLSITGVYQEADFFKDLSGSKGKGSVAADLGLNFHPTRNDEAQITLSFAAGNGLKKLFSDKGFALMPNADDLEDDLKDINGRNRDYLLEAWYKHTFEVDGWSVAPTVGIVDATVYIDDNNYANDETTQFMNDAFVNNPIAELPSYDLGGVLEVSKGKFNLRLLAMNPKGYDYYTVQAALYGIKSGELEGNYRLYYYRTSKSFDNYKQEKDYKEGLGFSGDWTLPNNWGFFARVGINTHTDTGDFKSFLSGGTVIPGFKFFRVPDSFGLALGYLDGNEKVSGIKNVKVGEAYYSVNLNEYALLTFDLQYQEQKQSDKNLGAWVYGVRLTASF